MRSRRRLAIVALTAHVVGAAANFVVLLLFAAPLLRVLRRFRRRFTVEVVRIA